MHLFLLAPGSRDLPGHHGSHARWLCGAVGKQASRLAGQRASGPAGQRASGPAGRINTNTMRFPLGELLRLFNTNTMRFPLVELLRLFPPSDPPSHPLRIRVIIMDQCLDTCRALAWPFPLSQARSVQSILISGGMSVGQCARIQ